MKRVFIVFIVLVAAISTALYLKLRDQAAEAARPSGGSATVEGTEIDVVARSSDRIKSIAVDEGDTVTAGQVLVELECKEYRAMLEQAEAGVEAAKVGLEGAKVTVDMAKQTVSTAERQARAARAGVDATKAQKAALKVQRDAAKRSAKRLEKVLASGASTEQQLDLTQSQAEGLDKQMSAVEASARAAQAQAAVVESGRDTADLQVGLAGVKVKGAEEQLAAAEATRRRALVAVGECTLVAPRDAVVQSRNYESGEVVNPGTRVLTLIDTREVKATFYLPNAELGAATPGREVELTADAYPDRTFKATIRRVATSAEFTPRNVQTREDRDRLVYAVEVALENPDGALHPGMPVEVEIPGTGK